MRKLISILYIALCIVLCAIPLVGMSVYPTNTTTENTEMVKMPSLTKKGKPNLHYLSELGNYFENHFSFRNEMVASDAKIMGKVFQVSAEEKVVYGKNGWLFYQSTVDDYLGRNALNKRELYNLARNLSIVQEFAKENEMDFLFTIPPNKNSLYDDNMPYYLKKASKEHNIENLVPYLKKKGVNYSDLYSLFKNNNETLYLKRDSHWNNKGAVLAYHQMLTDLNKKHDNFETVPSIREENDYGDLNKMLFPKFAEPEFNMTYQYQQNWKYTSGKKTDDYSIATENPKGEGTLMMYRDSFTNTLLPLMSNVYKNAYYENSRPFFIGTDVEEHKPDTLIIEKVERNINEFISYPPVLSLAKDDVKVEESKDNKASISIQENDYDINYFDISGSIQSVPEDADILVSVSAEDDTTTYEAYGLHENDYVAYIPVEDYEVDEIKATVAIRQNDKITPLATKNLDLSSFWEEE